MLEIKRIVLCALAVLCSCSIVTEAATQTDIKDENNLAHHLNTVQDSLEVLSRSIRSAKSDLLRRQLDECQELGPMSNDICSLFVMDGTVDRTDLVDQLVQEPYTPGKRSVRNIVETDRRKRLLDDLYRKETMLKQLESVIDDAKDNMQQERKRSCNLNLGFHCKTEQYSQIADMYNWLQSSLSPGRRKRSVSQEIVPSQLEW